jgi:hypothetical protein
MLGWFSITRALSAVPLKNKSVLLVSPLFGFLWPGTYVCWGFFLKTTIIRYASFRPIPQPFNLGASPCRLIR